MYLHSGIIKSRLIAACFIYFGFFSTQTYAQQLMQLQVVKQVEYKNQALAAKIGAMSKLDPALTKIYRQQSLATSDALLTAYNPFIRLIDDGVLIDAVAVASDTQSLQRDLKALGMSQLSSFGRVVSGIMPLVALENLAALKSLQLARPTMAMTWAGSVTSQGDRAMRADKARKEEEVTGRRVTIGVMSDSYDCLRSAREDIASGDLPGESRIQVLAEGICPASDEGRGMMQLIHDVAPGSDQAFHTAFGGQADFASGIVELAVDAGSDIVVDDVIYFAEPMFQDGIIAQAVDQVKSMGVSYFSSAGNGGRNSWDTGAGGFVASGVSGVFGGMRHDFDPGPGIDDLQSVLIGTGTTIFAFQWDEPFASVSGAPGSASDMDIILYLPGGGFIGLGGYAFNVGGDAVEVFGVRNSGPPAVLEIGLELYVGPAPGFMKQVVYAPSSDDLNDPVAEFFVEYANNSSTNYGHSNAAGAAGVGAAYWRNTPRYGVSPPRIENFSSAGGTPILFSVAGDRISPIDRRKPDFVGPDGGITTFFGGRDEYGNRAPGGNHFFGTSASAPHTAAVAALMLQVNRKLSPDAIYRALKKTAIDMDDPMTPGFDRGYDVLTGYGFVDAEKAVGEID